MATDGRTGTARFDEESRAFLQQRLRLFALVLSVLLWTLIASFALSMATQQSFVRVAVRFTSEFPNALLFYLASLTSAVWGILRTRRLSDLWLTVCDGALLEALIAICLILYFKVHAFEWSGFAFVVTFLTLFILTRAVLIPSTGARTLLLSLPAPVGVFAIQMFYGASFAFYGQPYRQSHFVDSWIQNQVCLWGAIAVAMTASRVHQSLRRRSFDAARVGQYDVHEQIGAGGMGEVYRATHSLLKRSTALKFLRPEIAGSKSLARFEQEVRLASRLTHPNNIAIYDYGYTAEGVFYYAMELLDGGTLREVLDFDGPLPQARVVHVLSQALAALQEAHTKGILHRDIKSANVMLCERGGELDCVKVLDFGLAKPVDAQGVARADGEVAGSAETMSPESILGRDLAPQSDLYSLSVVAYQLLSGRHPFEADTAGDMLRHHLSTTPPTLTSLGIDVDPALEELVLQGLHKDPGRRPSSAGDMRQRLRLCSAHARDHWDEDDARRWWERFETRESRPHEDSEITSSASETRFKTEPENPGA